MNYIIFDIETNARKYKTDKPQEVIQIGAIKLNESLQEIGQFSKVVRPTVCPKLSEFSHKLTGITQEEINRAQSFTIVFKQFMEWADPQDQAWVCWGSEDIRFLKNDCLLNQLTDEVPVEFINLLERFKEHTQSKNDFSLVRALEHLEEEAIGDSHTAIGDAQNTSIVFKRIFEHVRTMELDVYKRHPLNSRTRSSIKHIVKKMIQDNHTLEWEAFLEVIDAKYKNMTTLINEENVSKIKEYYLREVSMLSEV